MLKIIAPGTKVSIKTDKDPIEGTVIKAEINYENFVMYSVDYWAGNNLCNTWIHKTQIIDPPESKEIGFHTVR